jgi:hypothetical protein
MCITDRYFIICKIYISERLIVVLEYYRENLQKIAKKGKYSRLFYKLVLELVNIDFLMETYKFIN